MKTIKIKIAHGSNEVSIQQLIPAISRMKPSEKWFLPAGLSVPTSPATIMAEKKSEFRITTMKVKGGYVIQRNR